MTKKVIKDSFLSNLEEEIDFSNFLIIFQKNKFLFGCSSSIIFIILSFFLVSSRKWIASIDIRLNTKSSINFGLVNFSDTRVSDSTRLSSPRHPERNGRGGAYLCKLHSPLRSRNGIASDCLASVA